MVDLEQKLNLLKRHIIEKINIKIKDMTDNLFLIKELLKFKDENSFYHIQIIKRRKDKGNEEMSIGQKEIKSYIVKSLDYLENKYDEIKEICIRENARAYININTKSLEQVAHLMNIEMAKIVAQKNYNRIERLFNSTVSKSKGENKYWILDIDAEDIDKFENSQGVIDFEEYLYNIRPIGNKIVTRIPSKTGVHFITTKFDVKQFNEKYNIEIKKNSVTNLFIP